MLHFININNVSRLFRKDRHKALNSSQPLIDRLRREIDSGRLCCSQSTTINRTTAVNALERFFAERLDGGRGITLDTLTSNHIKAFERWHLDQQLTLNYSACNMRNLRALLNYIVGPDQAGHIRQLFRDVHTTKAQPQSKKAVGRDFLHDIENLPLRAGSGESFARDCFLFSFYAMGMPPVDMVRLRRSQLEDGVISYYRQKTHRLVNVTVTPELREILGRLVRADSSYLLPVLTSDDPDTMQREYCHFYQQYRRRLKKISAMIGPQTHLTPYTPRHTWASIAYEEGVNVNYISQCLGHSNIKTTYAYLTEICGRKLYEANRIVIQSLKKELNKGFYPPHLLNKLNIKQFVDKKFVFFV